MYKQIGYLIGLDTPFTKNLICDFSWPVADIPLVAV